MHKKDSFKNVKHCMIPSRRPFLYMAWLLKKPERYIRVTNQHMNSPPAAANTIRGGLKKVDVKETRSFLDNDLQSKSTNILI